MDFIALYNWHKETQNCHVKLIINTN